MEEFFSFFLRAGMPASAGLSCSIILDDISLSFICQKHVGLTIKSISVHEVMTLYWCDNSI